MKQKKLLVVPGVYKSGTSTLYNIITQHDRIHKLENDKRTIKEPNFLALEYSQVKDKYEDYYSLFGPKDGWYVDASVSYFLAPNILNLIEHLNCKIKCIITVRDPIERVHSSYVHMNSRNEPPERRNFKPILDSIHKRISKGVKYAEQKEIKEAAKKGEIDKCHMDPLYIKRRNMFDFAASFQDSLWPYRYFEHSLYCERIDRIASQYPTQVISLENLLENPSRVTDKVFSFLGLTNENVTLSRSNPSKVNTRLGNMYLKLSRVVSNFGTIKRLLDRSIPNYLKEIIRPYLKTDRLFLPSRDTINKLYDIFKTEYKNFSSKYPGIYANWNERYLEAEDGHNLN